MSVAAHLNTLRLQTPAETSKIPSLFQKPHPRTEAAANALNSLEVLSTIDPILPTLAEPLLLHEPTIDRATLPSEILANLSNATITLFRRLAPILPLKPAQVLLEWPIAHLHLGRYGTDDEINTLLIAALPFHSTPFFPLLIHTVLTSSVKRSNWQWLLPFAREQKRPTIDHIATFCPDTILRAAIQECVQSPRDNISNPHISNLVTSVVSLRLANPHVQGRRQLALSVASAIADIVSNDAPFGDSFDDAVCNFLSCISTTISSGTPEGVGPALAHAVVAVLRSFPSDSPVCVTSAVALALITRTIGRTALPLNPLRKSLADGRIATSLLATSHKDVAETYTSCMLALTDVQPSKSIVSALQKALSIESELLSSTAVEQVIVAVLKAASASDVKYKEKKRQSIVEHLASFLSPLARGRHADTMDRALRKHFASRSTKKSHQKRYHIVDEALAIGLHRTQFELVKVEAMKDGEQISGGTILTSLEHPEPLVRKAGIQRVYQQKLLENADSGAVKDQLYSKLKYILETDQDIEVITIAGKCMLQMKQSGNIMPQLRSLIKQYKQKVEKLSAKKRMKLPEQMKDLFSVILSLCENLLAEESFEMHAMIVGMAICGLFPQSDDHFRQTVKDLLGKIKETEESMPILSLAKSRGKSLYEVAHDYLESIVTSSKPMVLSKLFHSVAKWDPSWALEVLKISLQRSSTTNGRQVHLKNLFLELGKILLEEYPHLRVESLKTLTTAVPYLCSGSEEDKQAPERSRLIWDLVLRDYDFLTAQNAATAIIKELGLTGFLDDVLREICTSHGGLHLVSQRRNLQWYISLCRVQPLERIKTDACAVVLKCLYGDDEELRTEIQRLASLEKLNKLPKEDTISDLTVLLRTISKLAETDEITTVEEGLGGDVVNEIHRITAVLRNSDLPPALQHEQDASSVISRLFEDVLERILKITETGIFPVFLFRAIAGFKSKSEATSKKLWTILTILVEKLSDTGRNPDAYHLECIVLAIKILASAKFSSTAKSSVVTVGRTTIDCIGKLTTAEFTNFELSPSMESVLVIIITLLLSKMSITNEGSDVIREQLIGFSLFFGTKSTQAGAYMRQIIHKMFGSHLTFKDLAPYAQNVNLLLNASTKKRRLTREGINPIMSAIVNETAEGSLEALRMILPSMEKIDSNEKHILNKIRISLWECITLIDKRCRDHNDPVENLREYEVTGVLNALTEIHMKLPSTVSVTGLRSLVEIVFFPRRNYEGEETGVIVAVRRSALDLLESLAPTQGPDLQSVISPVVESLLCTSETTRSLQALQRLIPSLFKSECDLEKVCTWLTTAAYGDRPEKSTLERRRQVLATCGRLVPNITAAFMAYLECIARMVGDIFDREQAAKECALLLQAGDLSATEDIELLQQLPSDLKHSISASYIISSSFSSKLAQTGEFENNINGSLGTSICDLFLNLLENGTKDESENSGLALLSVTPLAVMETCITRSLQCDDNQVRKRALHILKEKLRSDDSLLCSWSETADDSWVESRERNKLEHSFLMNVGSSICSLFSPKMLTDTNVDVSDIQFARIAAETLEQLIGRMGSSSSDTLESFSKVLSSLFPHNSSLTNILDDEHRVSLLAGILDCAKGIITNLRKLSIRLSPKVLDVTCRLLERVLGGNLSSSKMKQRKTESYLLITETCIRVITVIFDYAPALVGSRTLERLAMLMCLTDSRVIPDVLSMGVAKVSSQCAAQGLSNAVKKLETKQIPTKRISLLLQTMTNGIESMQKGDTKLFAETYLNTGLNCIEHHRSTYKMLLGNKEYAQELLGDVESMEEYISCGNEQSDDRELDESCAEMLATLILKLSETEFNKIFKTLLQWSSDGSLPKTVKDLCEMANMSIDENIMRSLPFLRVVCIIFERLERIFVPYFLQIHDRIISTISQKKKSYKYLSIKDGETGKKRNREALKSEVSNTICTHISQLHDDLKEMSLKVLVIFLRQDLGGNVFSSAMVTSIQESLLQSFDDCQGESDDMSRCFIGLAGRIVGLGQIENWKEESRQLLVGLARGILKRTHEDDDKVRENALVVSSSIASNVGDEYLVTLPESMPILAEVIDDESAKVVRAAVDFVQVMESLAGESIMDQIR